MKKFLTYGQTLCSLLAISLMPLASQAAESKPCPYTEAYLSEQLGVTLKVVTQMPGLLGPACEYADAKRSLKIAVDAGRNPAPSAEAWRKMSNPPGTKWKAIAGDPDKAVILEASPNMELQPSLSYEHKTWLVQINVMGIKANEVAKWNEKLLKLKRLPE